MPNVRAELKQSIEALGRNVPPLLFVSSNKIKNDLFEKTHSKKPFVLVDNTDEIFFKEATVKQHVERNFGRPINYPSRMAEGKALATAMSLKGEIEGSFTVVTADSVLLVPRADGKGYDPLNRDGDVSDEAMIDRIVTAGEVVYSGAVAAADERGGVYSVQTYVKFPIGQRPSKLPYSFEELEEMYQASDQDAQVEVGFLKPWATSEGIKFDFEPVNNKRYDRSSDAFDFLSGVEEESLKVVEKAVEFDRKVAPTLQEVITTHPFNTYKYVLPDVNLNDPEKHLIDGIGLMQGGDCTFMTDRVYHKLKELHQQGIEYRVATFDTQRYPVSEGHVGFVITDSDNTFGLVDGGMTISHPVIYSKARSLQPLSYAGGKKQAMIIEDRRGNHSLVQVKNNGNDKMTAVRLARGRDYTTRVDYLKLLTRIQPETVRARNTELTFEIFDGDGIKTASFVTSRDGNTRVKVRADTLYDGPLTIEDEALSSSLALFGVTSSEVMGAYNNWIRITKPQT